MKLRTFTALLLAAIMLFALTACGSQAADDSSSDQQQEQQDVLPDEGDETPDVPDNDGADAAIDEDGSYTSKEDVALYIHTYGHLPENYITKDEARALGWEGGSVEVYQEGAAIGGDRFGNREGLLPEQTGRSYTECDINTDGADSRGAERLIFSNDGLYFYTSDHYASFTELTVDGGTVVWSR